MDWRNKPKSFWKERLTDLQYKVTQEAATEAPHSGEYLDNKEKGEYLCICCATPLFESRTKFESYCGWPSFYASKTTGNAADPVEYRDDKTHGMERTEILCKTCGAHLGHVFDDGPKPTGKRYCLNSAALKFSGEEKA